MKLLLIVVVLYTLPGCGTDNTALMNGKLDAPLRQRLTELQGAETPQVIDILGKCSAPIDGQMRKTLVGAGADVVTLTDDIFTARVSSSSILDVAALEFVTQLQLSQISNPLLK